LLAVFAVIFDFDGTILDSEAAEYQSHKRFFADYGVTLSPEEWCTGIGIVQPDTHWFDWLCGRCEPAPTFQLFRERTRRYFREALRLEPMPGVAELIGALDAAGVPRAIASTASSEWVRGAVSRLNLTQSFSAIVTGDDVRRGKPAPDVYLEAARRLNIAPERCVALEDSGPGVASAKAAGMKVVAIPHTLSRSHSFDGADLHVRSAAALSMDALIGLFR
jgi:HAD superfamily hydrolase (TIGR01509 family)